MYVRVIVFVNLLNLLEQSLQIVLDDYCKFAIQNIPCDSRCTRHRRCGPIDPEFPSEMTNYDRGTVVYAMNKVRQEVASGQNPRKFPPAANMNALSYDMECEFMAKCFCDMCSFNSQRIMISLKGEVMGYRAYGLKVYNDSDDNSYFDIYRIIHLWYSQYTNAPDFTLWNRNTFFQEYIMAGRRFKFFDFMQLIWAKTKYVGCAKNSFDLRRHKIYVFACVFLPSGCLNNELTYIPGPPKSKCDVYPSNYSREHFPMENLCGGIRLPSGDKYIAPEIELNSTVSTLSSTGLSLVTYVLVLLDIF